MNKIGVFLKGLLAGIMIAIGGTVYLSVDNRIIGAFLFAVGLFAICTLDMSLFTGKVCYALDNDGEYVFDLSIIWFGNIVGTYLVSLIEHFTRIYPALHQRAVEVVSVKLSDGIVSIFLLSLLCNVLIYLAVEEYKNNPHDIGKYLGILFGVAVFIICGFEHCVANMYYISVADLWSLKALLYVFVMSAGNACGGLLIPLVKRGIKND